MFDRTDEDGGLTVLASLRRRAEDSQLQEDEAKAFLSRATQIRRLWVTLGEHLGHGRPVAAFLECERALEKPDDLSAADVALLHEVTEFLRPKVDRVLASAEIDIPEALASAGLRLDPTARHPNYTMESGFITVVVDERKRVASISSRGGSPRKEALDPTLVAGAAVEVRNRVFHRKASHVTPARLTQAYRALTRTRHAAESGDVAIDAIRLQLSPKGRPIPPDEFNVDLAALVRGASETGTPRITLSNTRDTRAGLLLFGLEDAGYVGYLKIEGV